MWTWIQTGLLIGPDGSRSPGYSGKGACKNQPEAQDIKNWGPIPCGVYRIGDPHDSADHGPFVLPLTPDSANEMFGRDSFLIHGDSISAPGTASEGCIILPRPIREKIATSGDRELQVIANESIPTVATDPGMEAE
jgi:hypothetical protein